MPSITSSNLFDVYLFAFNCILLLGTRTGFHCCPCFCFSFNYQLKSAVCFLDNFLLALHFLWLPCLHNMFSYAVSYINMLSCVIARSYFVLSAQPPTNATRFQVLLF